MLVRIETHKTNRRPKQSLTAQTPANVCYLGRIGADIAFNDPMCSRRHASLVISEEGKLYLKDLGSLNGTYLNGKRIVREELSPNDKILIGDTLFQVKEFSPSLNMNREENTQEKLHQPSINGSVTQGLPQILELRSRMDTKKVG